MVSDRKLKYFSERVIRIRDKKLAEIEKKFPSVSTDYKSLVGAGKGTLKSEAEIRQAIAKQYRSSCPPSVDIFQIFDFNGEQKAAEKASIEREKKVESEKRLIEAQFDNVMDIVYLGSEEELLKSMSEFEAI